MAASLFRPQVERLTVLYDADCAFCTWTVGQLRSLDRAGRLEMLPLQHVADHPDRPEIADAAARRDLRRSIHVVRDDGGVREGGGAMLEILDALPGGWLLRPWAALPGVERVVDTAYRALARRRSSLGRLLARRTGAPACDVAPGHVT